MITVPLADWKVSWKQKRLVNKVLKSGRLTYGPITEKLEEKFAELHDWGYVLFTSSGTDALKIAIHAMKDKYGWKDGDEILIPAVTFVATMNVVVMNNLVPVLVDIDQDTLNIDPAKMKQSMTNRTRAIIPVHLLGRPADMQRIIASAKKNNLKVIEDSCEMMGIDYEPRGDVACYSTYLAHLVTTGVGGFIATNDKKLATTMRSMMFHGRDESYLNIDDIADPSAHYKFPRFGYSDRLTELEAALGLVELDSLAEIIKTRQFNASLLGPTEPNHAYMFYPIFAEDRDDLASYLADHDIQTRQIMPLTNQPIAQKYLKNKKFPRATFVNNHGLLLPCHQYLSDKQIKYVVQTIKEFHESMD